MAKTGGLGRGLKALISDVEPQSGEYFDVDVTLVFPNPSQPRRYFDELRLEGLAQSIRENGVVQPLVVRRLGTRYEVIAGERRWRAAKLAGLQTVPVVVKSMTDSEAMRVALLENIQREDLNPLEEAEAYRTLIEEYSMTQEALAESLGRSRPSISNALRLLSLAAPLREMVERGLLSMGHARALLSIDDVEEQVALAKRTVDEGLSVRDVERLAQRSGKKVPRGTKAANLSPDATRVEEALRSSLGTKVRFRPGRGDDRGRIEIEYFSRDELERLLEILVPSGL